VGKSLALTLMAAQAEQLLADAVRIADDSSRDYVKKTGADGKVTWVVDYENIRSVPARKGPPAKLIARIWIKKGETE
jgi:hypothetical protein